MRSIEGRSARRIAVPVLLAIPLVASAATHAAVWSEHAPHGASDTALLHAPLHRYRALTLDVAALHAQLAAAPRAKEAAAPARIELPMPDGTLQAFAVRRVDVMAPALAARYPRIRSYSAVAIGHADVQARLDDSPLGFSAMIRGSQGVAMVQPVALGSAQYIAFDRHDLGASEQPFRCGLDSANASRATPAAGQPQTSTGATIRTYRLAVAATGEYVAYFGGTVELGLAAVVQAINRINGIYLTEFAVQFELIANEDAIIYTDPATDPYTNDSPTKMYSQNQKNLDNVIGTANYDFGHVFSTLGGGLAGLGVVCKSKSKAEGVTGIPEPVGDAYWVDYVAHEMGHQMGADHTFNSTDDNCGGGNRAASEAVETGSGSTIMAYAGICTPSNLQPHSDAYFSAASLTPIAGILATSGATCGTAAASTDVAPAVDAFPEHTIPVQTAFALTGAASDDDGDAITYDWEEMDLGTASPPEGDDGSRPIFRSFNPTTSPVRIVPELARVLAHDPSIDVPSGGDISGEYWATTTRDLNFRLTVRDNHADGGATSSSDAIVHVTSAAGPFRVTAPGAGDSWLPGVAATVSWNVAGTNLAPVGCAAVDILLSTDGGQTFATTLASSVPNNGSASVTVPVGSTSTARVEVACHDNIFFDISPADFVILGDEIFGDGFD